MAADGGGARRLAGGDRNTVSSPIPPRRSEAIHATATSLGAAIGAAHRAGDGGATYRGLEARTGHKAQRIHDWTDPVSGREARLSAPEECGDRVAIAYYEDRLAALRARASATPVDLADLALDVSDHCGGLAREIREAKRDGKIDLREIARIEAEALAAKAHLCSVLSECARLRAGGAT